MKDEKEKYGTDNWIILIAIITMPIILLVCLYLVGKG